MKKIIKIIFPSILMLFLIFLWRDGKDILNGIYIFFPIIYISNSLIYSHIKELILSLILLAISFLIPINLWFHMGSCVGLVIFYSILSGISFFIKKLIENRKDRK